jgi:hypothetical protein
LAFPLLGVAWAPVLVLLHELGHALAAILLTDGDVELDVRGAGVLGGKVTYEASRIRRPRDEAWIAAAGPAVSLVLAVVLWLAWLGSGATSLVTIVGAGAFSATLQFFTSALPLRYGAGLGGPADSDGRVIWRVLTGAPPGGIERELRRAGEPEPVIRPRSLAALVLVFLLAVLVSPGLALTLVVMLAVGALLQRYEARRGDGG